MQKSHAKHKKIVINPFLYRNTHNRLKFRGDCNATNPEHDGIGSHRAS